MGQNYRTIKIKKYSDVIEEYKAAAALTPGMLLELTSSGTVRKHASANTFAFPMFALEDELQGKSIDQDYAANDQVQCWIPYRGDIVYAIIADGQNITVGDPLVSNGLGFLRKSLDTYNSWESVDAGMDISNRVVIGVALESLDLSTAEGSDSSALGDKYPRIKVRVV